MRAAIEADTRSPKLGLTIAAPAGEAKIVLIEVSKIHQYRESCIAHHPKPLPH
jgi:hypothetical protein